MVEFAIQAVSETAKKKQLADALLAQAELVQAKRIIYDFRFSESGFLELVKKVDMERDNPMDEWQVLTWQR